MAGLCSECWGLRLEMVKGLQDKTVSVQQFQNAQEAMRHMPGTAHIVMRDALGKGTPGTVGEKFYHDYAEAVVETASASLDERKQLLKAADLPNVDNLTAHDASVLATFATFIQKQGTTGGGA